MALICYHGEEPNIIDQKRADTVLQVISDPERRKIISLIKDEFKTANEISKQCGIPISSVYRRLNELSDKKLLITSGRITTQKKREDLYKSKIRKVVTVFDNDELDVKIYTNLRGKEKHTF